MSSRVIYRLGVLITACTWLIYSAIFLATAFIQEWGWATLVPFGLALWSSYRVAKASDELRSEANRDSRLGADGPFNREDML